MPVTICASAAGTSADENPLVPYDGIQITSEQRADFDRDGYLVIRDAIPPELLERLIQAQDRVYAQQEAQGLLSPKDHSMHLMGFLYRDKAFLELLELPAVFPLVWGILGWNIHAYHHHIDLHPGISPDVRKTWRWHQDGGHRFSSSCSVRARTRCLSGASAISTRCASTGASADSSPESEQQPLTCTPYPELGRKASGRVVASWR